MPHHQNVDWWHIALVEVDGEQTTTHYITHPFQREPDFDATSVIYDLEKLLHKEVRPQ